MTQNQRIEQNIDFYTSHLKHIDELLERSSKGVTKSPEHADIHAQITNLKTERDQFAEHIETLKLGSTADMQEQMIEGAGPMGVWDALAQQLEKLVERIER
ncbi:MAG: hypothetical protein GZ093_19900 [Rhodoferax sp.]|uniref:hypothetical protein n=1 Tax=Rhodoferax sp. TaxID=50421 RepID=UPI001400386C|nr:hypothetical protein [Rhodoferax sp.]NDP40957.1 hypothetical protein [Rhodoferax sp.]